MPHLSLDHIVLVVPDLQKAIQFFEEFLNVSPIIGGKHLGFGTHNALLGLGSPEKLTYLELFAIDPEDKTSYEVYPMGISPDIQDMYIGSWCIRCDTKSDIGEIVQAMQHLGQEYDLGDIRKMQRMAPSNAVLSWQLASTPEQAIISNGQVPFLIKWDDLTLHPATRLSPENFIAYNLNFSGPKSQAMEENLSGLGFEKPEHITFTEAVDVSINFSLYGKNKTITFGCRPGKYQICG